MIIFFFFTDKRDVHVRQVLATPPIAITITRYLKQSLYSVPLGPDLIITGNDYIAIETQNDKGITVTDISIQLPPPVLSSTSSTPSASSSTVAPSSTVARATTTTMATSEPSPTTALSRFSLSSENLNYILIAVVSGLVFALVLTCCLACVYGVCRHTPSHLVKSRDLESAQSFTPTQSATDSKDNLITSSNNSLPLTDNTYENTQSAIVPTKYSLDVTHVSQQQMLSLPNSARNSMDTLVGQSSRDRPREMSTDV